MNVNRCTIVLLAAVIGLASGSTADAQSPSVLYTWDGSGDIRDWAKAFGDNATFLDNTNAGELTLFETGTDGEDIAFRDSLNRIRESSTSQQGGLDLTGLDFLEFDLGHSGSGNIDVQFFVQGEFPCCTYVALGPDLAVSPGVNTYQVPLSGLTFEQQVYNRTVGFNVREHVGEGNVIWTLEEIRSGGTPLTQRTLVDHNVGSSDGGLQGAIANFDLGAILGNDGGQNQSGLVHNPVDGSLQWKDLGDHGVGDPSGAAVTWANGTAWLGNSFNERMTDLSNYDFVTFRLKATDIVGPLGGSVGVQPFFQTPGFESVGFENLPIDGAFHELTFPLAGVTGDMALTNWTGINLASHTNDIVIDVDHILFTTIPEPTSSALLAMAAVASLGLGRRARKAC